MTSNEVPTSDCPANLKLMQCMRCNKVIPYEEDCECWYREDPETKDYFKSHCYMCGEQNMELLKPDEEGDLLCNSCTGKETS